MEYGTKVANRYLGERLERLEIEIKNQAATVVNGVVMRREHPSYGYTKAGLRHDLSVLEGMLLAWLVVTRMWNYSGTPMLRNEECEAISAALGIDIPVLREDVKKS